MEVSDPGSLNNSGRCSQKGEGQDAWCRLAAPRLRETETRKLGQRKDVGEEGKVKSRGWAPGDLVGKTEKFRVQRRLERLPGSLRPCSQS